MIVAQSLHLLNSFLHSAFESSKFREMHALVLPYSTSKDSFLLRISNACLLQCVPDLIISLSNYEPEIAFPQLWNAYNYGMADG